MSKKSETNIILWCDCEMTGLDINTEELIEVALLTTDFELNVLDSGLDIIIKPSTKALNNMSSFVRKMHQKSGVLDELDNGKTLEECEKELIKFVEIYSIEKGTLILAGNSIYNDRQFINKYLPKFAEYLHYRMIDVSSIKELAKRWFPKELSTKHKKVSKHKATEDILDSISELKFYKNHVFKPEEKQGFLASVFNKDE